MDPTLHKILTDWAVRVPDGSPDPANPYHMVLLERSIDGMGLPRRFKQGLLQRLRKEEEDWWSKLSSEEQAQYIKDHPKSQKAKEARQSKDGDDIISVPEKTEKHLPQEE